MRQQKAYVVHHIPGRMRLKVPRAKGNPAALKEVCEFVSGLPGVSSVEVNAQTGSVLIHYDHNQSPEFHGELRRRAEREDLFSLVPDVKEAEEVMDVVTRDADLLAKRSAAARFVVDTFDGLDLRMKRATNNALSFRVLLLFGVAGYAVFEAIREKTFGPGWLLLVLSAFDSFTRAYATPGSSGAAAPSTAASH
jgi:Heavy metal associated domain 2